MIGDDAADHFVEQLAMPFARIGSAEVAFRVDERDGRPSSDAEAAPDFHFRVVDDRMFDLIPQRGSADVFGLLLIVELRRMHADDDQLFRIFLLEVFQVRQDVHAVDAAVRPEVEDDDLAPQILQRDWTRRVQPFNAAVQLSPFEFEASREGVLDFGRFVLGLFGSLFRGGLGLFLGGLVCLLHFLIFLFLSSFFFSSFCSAAPTGAVSNGFCEPRVAHRPSATKAANSANQRNGARRD